MHRELENVFTIHIKNKIFSVKPFFHNQLYFSLENRGFDF
jgi:hypothetical protein